MRRRLGFGHALRAVCHRHLQVLQLGDVLADRLVQLKAPFVIQGQQRCAGHQLGQRKNLVEAVWLKRPLLLQVGKAVFGALHDLAVLIHQRGDTADAPLLHLLGHGCGKGVQTRLGKGLRCLLGMQTAGESCRQQHRATQQLTHVRLDHYCSTLNLMLART